ncbi:MAG TPA: hypothetical protein VEW71_08750 [Allosphingosinicella sp.]|nr:hypothetical protein [Allosphingosinicella sp.]
MRKPRSRPPLKSGLDRVGPFHPYLVYAAVLALDLLGVVLILAALVWIGDIAEDLFWPGGAEWVDL